MTSPRRGTPDFLLLFLTLALVAFGLMMVYSSSSMVSTFKYDNSFIFAKKQAVAVGLGAVGMLFFMNVPYSKLKKWTLPLFAIVLLLLVLVLFFGNGDTQYGARSWIDLGPFNLQPAEFAKLAVILYLANLIRKKGDKMYDLKKGLIPCLVITGILAFLIMLQPDLGSCLVLVLGAMVIITIGGANLKHIFVLGGSALALGIAYFGLSYLSNPNSNNYRLKRITTLFDPWSDSSDSTYQMVNSLLAFGHGGFTGTGLSRSIQKINFLSQSHSDFIFAIIGEELGFLGTSLFLLVYCLFVWRGIVVSLRNPDPYASLIGVGIMSMIAIQTLINIGGVTNSIPMTGITLPLISYGGSSVLATMISMGMVLSISRDQTKPSPNKKRT